MSDGTQFDLQAFLKTVAGHAQDAASAEVASDVSQTVYPQEMSATSDGLPGIGDQLEKTQLAAAAHLMGLLQPSADKEAADELTVAPAPPKHSASATAAASALAHVAAAEAAGTVLGSGASSSSSQPAVGQPIDAFHSVYNIDTKRDPCMVPQLEVTPITIYHSAYNLTLGHKIAVNKNYICYGLKTGQIRILNMFTAVRTLLRGHTEAVGDLRFFSDEVDMLGTTSKDGRVFIRRISETPQDQSGGGIVEHVMLTLHLVEILDKPSTADSIVSFCWHTVDQNTFAVAASNAVHVCKLDELIAAAGSSPLDFSLRASSTGSVLLLGHSGEVTNIAFSPSGEALASCSEDGTIGIWNTVTGERLVEVVAHGGSPVYSVSWAEDPSQGIGASLISGGKFNKEVKLWVVEPELWLAECKQIVTLESSQCPEDSFFNHVLFDAASSLMLLANTKKNAIYALRLVNGSSADECPRFVSISQFEVTMPILSFTSLCELSLARASVDGSERDAAPSILVFCVQTLAIQQYVLDSARCEPNYTEAPVPMAPQAGADTVCDAASEPVGAAETHAHASPDLKATADESHHPVLQNPDAEPEPESAPCAEQVVASPSEAACALEQLGENMEARDSPAHSLLTPMQLMALAATSPRVLEAEAPEAEGMDDDTQAVDGSLDWEAREDEAAALIASDVPDVGDETRVDETDPARMKDKTIASSGGPAPEPELKPVAVPAAPAAPANNVGMDPAALNAAVITSLAPLVEELRYRDAIMIQHMETIIVKQADMAKALLEDERQKRDKAEKERQEKLLMAISSSINRDLLLQIEKVIRKELATFAPTVADSISQPLQQLIPAIERAVTSAVTSSLSSRLPPALSEQIQESFRSQFEGSLLPAFEASSREMFQQVHVALEVGVQQHAQAVSARAVPLIENLNHSVSASAGLAEAMGLQQSQLAMLLETQHQRAMMGAEATASAQVLPVQAVSLAALEERLDPTIDIKRLLGERKFEDAFNKALTLSDVSVVTWLIKQVEPSDVFACNPPALSQALLLSLAQQLGCDLGNETALKLDWIQQTTLSLDPEDALLAAHMRPILGQLYNSLLQLMAQKPEQGRAIRMVVLLVNSLMGSCK